MRQYSKITSPVSPISNQTKAIALQPASLNSNIQSIWESQSHWMNTPKQSKKHFKSLTEQKLSNSWKKKECLHILMKCKHIRESVLEGIWINFQYSQWLLELYLSPELVENLEEFHATFDSYQLFE